MFVGNIQSGVADVLTSESPTASANESIQAQFLMGIYALDSGQYEVATRIFLDLKTKSTSPRIDLELARSLYLSGYYQASKDIFDLAQSEHDLPLPVRRTVYNYLDEIDLELGFYRFDIGLVSDTNPSNFTSSKQVFIGGKKLEVTVPENNKEQRGVEYSLYGGKSLLGRHVVGRFNLNHTDFSSSDFDQSLLDFGLNIKPQSYKKIRISPGYAMYRFGGQKIYDLYYTGLRYYPDTVREFQQSHEIVLGRMVVAGAAQYDANKVSINSSFQRAVNDSYTVNYGLAADHHDAREKPYGFNKLSLLLGLEFPVSNVRVNLASFFGKKIHMSEDPLFGMKRKDTSASLSVSLRHESLMFLSRYLEVGLAYERVDSTLDFFTYDKTSVTFKLTERR